MTKLEELIEVKKKHCGIDCDGTFNNPSAPCLQFSRSVREQYAAKYGCICSIRCCKCKDHEECHK